MLLTASMDSNALFHDAAYGANDAAASLVALPSAADALSRLSEFLDPTPLGHPEAPNRHRDLPRRRIRLLGVEAIRDRHWLILGNPTVVVLVVVRFCARRRRRKFRGRSPVWHADRSYGEGACLDPLYPSLAFSSLALSDIEAVVVVDEIAATATSSPCLEPIVRASGARRRLSSTCIHDTSRRFVLNTLSGVFSSLSIALKFPTSLQSDTTSLPPSPLTSFLRARPDITGCVLGYDTAFTDATYHSHYDKPTTNAGGGGGGGSASSSSFDAELSPPLLRFSRAQPSPSPVRLQRRRCRRYLQCRRRRGGRQHRGSCTRGHRGG